MKYTLNTTYTKFTDATRALHNKRFGMFVHFGLYSAHAGECNGKKARQLSEWIMRTEEIPIDEYKSAIPKFLPTDDWAKKLVATAKNAGMRYIVITAKHHEGFCLFKSEYSDYNAYTYLGRDLIKELSDECKKQGLELGLYYSQCLDWYEKDGAGIRYSEGGGIANNDNFWDYPDRDNKDFTRFYYGKAFPQVKELLTNYGDIAIMWFDFPHDVTPEQSGELYEFVRKIQPDCVINSRIAHGYGDYYSMGDNSLPAFPIGFPIECCVTLNDTWGYDASDLGYKSSKNIIEIFARCISSDTTYLLNVGPRGDGSITEESLDILADVGEWVRENAEAIYDVLGNPFVQSFPFGYAAKKKNKIYLYVANTDCKTAVLGGIEDANPISAKRLGGRDVEFKKEEDTIRIELSENQGILPVYEVEFDKDPKINTQLTDIDGRISLSPLFAKKIKDDKIEDIYVHTNQASPRETGIGLAVRPECTTVSWHTTDEAVVWEINIKNSGKYSAVIECAQDFYEGGYVLKVDDITHEEINPKELKRIYLNKDEGANTRILYSMGEFEFKEPGRHTVSVTLTESGKAASLAAVIFTRI